MVDKPKATTSLAKQELDKAEKQFEAFDNQIKEMTLDRMNVAPKEDSEPQTKIAQRDLDKHKDVYLKPSKSIGSKEKFNEDYRSDYNFSMEYVNFIAENKEIIGETLEFWTKPFAGMPAQYWQVPTNKPLWAPRHVAERIKGCKYHRLVMQQTPTNSDGYGQYYGTMAADTTIQRLDAIPATKTRSVFMGANSFAA